MKPETFIDELRKLQTSSSESSADGGLLFAQLFCLQCPKFLGYKAIVAILAVVMATVLITIIVRIATMTAAMLML